MNKTKVIATIGPSTNSVEMIKRLINNGVDVIRVNTSHASIDFCKEITQKLNSVNSQLKSNVALMLDIKGPVIRVGKLYEGNAFYKLGSKIRIYTTPLVGDYTKFSIDFNVIKNVELGDKIITSDGRVELKIISIGSDFLTCEVINEGVIKEFDSLNIPNIVIERPYLTNVDHEYIDFAVNNDVSFIALSHIRSVEDVMDIDDLLIDLGNDHIGVIAKIENLSSMNDIDRIISSCDGVMISRGDLGIEVPIEKIPGIQKKIISKCHKAGVISIVAAELLNNMTDKDYPTRAEVSDIANAILDGTDAVMLSGETTIGKYPIEALKLMERVIKAAEEDINYENLIDVAAMTEENSVTGRLVESVATIASKLNCRAIFAPTYSGYTAKKISRFRPSCPIVAISPNVNTVKSLALNFGVCPFLINELQTLDPIIEKSKKFAEAALNLEKGDSILITGGYPFKTVKHTNFLQIEEI